MSNYAKINGELYVQVKDINRRYIELKRSDDNKMILVKCPQCMKERWIKNDHIERKKHSLCSSCAQRNIAIFYIDKDLDCAYFYVKDEKNKIKVLVDYEDADRLFGCSFGVSGYEKYIVISGGADRRMKLTDFILNHSFDGKKHVPDHRNHNIYDNRKSNLIIIKQTLNQGNKCIQKNNSTGFRGIIYISEYNSWKVQVRFNKEFVARKRFKKFIDAYIYWHDEYYEYYKNHAYNIFEDELKKQNLRYAGIKKFDIENGENIGYTLFVQGCLNFCKGCQNPQTWDFNGGSIYDKNIFNDMIDFYNKFPQVRRLTLCGGEPLQNLVLSNYVVAEFKRNFPDRKLWIYTGLLYDDIKDDIKYKAILELCDVLVDGKFIEEQKDLTLRFRGSTNQRIIDVQESLKQNKVILYDK